MGPPAHLVSRHEAVPIGAPAENADVSCVCRGDHVLLLVPLIDHGYLSRLPADCQDGPCGVPAQASDSE